MGGFYHVIKSIIYYGKVIRKLSDVNILSRNMIRSRDVSLHAITGDNITIMNGSHVDSFCSIGSYSFIGYNCFVTKAEIGRYCSVANNVSIGMGEHELNQISTNSIFYDNAFDMLTQKDCVLGNDVWIGVDSIIRRGVKIGHGAVVGANSYVTRDVPDFAVVGGSPAKIIKYRFNESQIAAILESRWWELDRAEAVACMKALEVTLAVNG